ncbi:mechanosensitive channel MscK [Halomonas cerina]|uniref:Potassium efflux system protein n=1 Tax=Halomonas cerina TaxID=447424 RepID=A0A839V966_9GAMM|nr:mechanosensitive channel MscK [Halomonas cerina]MBB3189267.1 potassium efflux system protein [Halomonas cerina]
MLSYLPVLGLIGWLLIVGVASAQVPALREEAISALSTRESIETRLEERRAAAGETPGTAAQQDIEALQATLDGLDRLQAVEEQLDALEARVAQVPEEVERLERNLDKEQQQGTGIDVETLEGLSLEELEHRQREASDELSRLQDRLARVETRLLGAQTLPERAQQAIGEAMQAAEAHRRRLEELESQGLAEDAPQRLRLEVEKRLAEAKIRLHRRELATNTRLRELDQQHHDLLERRIARQEARLSLLQRVIDHKRRTQSEQAVAEVTRETPQQDSGHPVVSQARQINREMSLELLRATNRATDLEREGRDVRRQLDRVHQLQRSLNEQIEAVRGSTLLSRILREQRQSLPQVEARRDLQDEIADLRLKQFELWRRREALRDGEALARQRLEEADAVTTPAVIETLQEIYQARRGLVERLEETYGELLSAGIELQLNQQQLLDLARELRSTIDEQLFWVANARPLDLAWLRHLPENLVVEWQEGEWRQALPVHWRLPDAGALLGGPVLLMALGLLGCRRRLKRYLTRLHDEIGRLRQDTQGHTPLAVAINALLGLPGPLALLAVGIALRAGGTGLAIDVGQALLHLALTWGVIAWARRLLVPDGVATRHFYWPSAYVARLRWWLLWLGVALIPVLLIAPLARGTAITLSQRPLALAILLAGLLSLSLVLVRLILAHTPFFGIRLFRLMLGLVLAMVPLVLAGLIVYGFEYTALSLVGRFVITLYLLGLWILVEATVVRGLAVAARRLAYRRALARRRAQQQEEAEAGPEVIEEPPLDMEQVNQQSLRLSKLVLMGGLFLLLYLVWSDLLAVLGYLERVALVDSPSGQENALVGSMVSVADLFTALLIVVLTLFMARNLPGLLEVMVLSRLELKQGSAYAITSLLSYVIVGSGVVAALATLGVSWNKLQWLVAALGVGLGFGLQEIFANFVSGLIILFERPVRIGDTITLGNLTGTVNRIRIRATTVTDFDRKEIIIPNKTFVTDQLINWSLSDTVTRVVLTYGVAYGSDHHLVHRLLHQAAEENPRVLADPEPQVFFMAYGSSTLDFELRIFVNGLVDRLFATDEINGRVGELFAAHGVEIAFNQLDVRLHRADGARAHVSTPARAGAEPPLHSPPGDPGDLDTGDGGEPGR